MNPFFVNLMILTYFSWLFSPHQAYKEKKTFYEDESMSAQMVINIPFQMNQSISVLNVVPTSPKLPGWFQTIPRSSEGSLTSTLLMKEKHMVLKSLQAPLMSLTNKLCLFLSWNIHTMRDNEWIGQNVDLTKKRFNCQNNMLEVNNSL